MNLAFLPKRVLLIFITELVAKEDIYRLYLN